MLLASTSLLQFDRVIRTTHADIEILHRRPRRTRRGHPDFFPSLTQLCVQQCRAMRRFMKSHPVCNENVSNRLSAFINKDFPDKFYVRNSLIQYCIFVVQSRLQLIFNASLLGGVQLHSRLITRLFTREHADRLLVFFGHEFLNLQKHRHLLHHQSNWSCNCILFGDQVKQSDFCQISPYFANATLALSFDMTFHSLYSTMTTHSSKHVFATNSGVEPCTREDTDRHFVTPDHHW